MKLGGETKNHKRPPQTKNARGVGRKDPRLCKKLKGRKRPGGGGETMTEKGGK